MIDSKPRIHGGGRWGLDESLKVRLFPWMRDMLYDLAEVEPAVDVYYPFDGRADDAGAIARELLSAALLKNELGTYYSNPQIIDGGDFSSDTKLNLVSEQSLNSSLTIRMPKWLLIDIKDYTGKIDSCLGESVSETVRNGLLLGYKLYMNEALPWGEPFQLSDPIICPNCWGERGLTVWGRTFRHPYTLDELLEELRYETENPYQKYLRSNYNRYGWMRFENGGQFESEVPFGMSFEDYIRDHPQVTFEATVCHCYICSHTADRSEFVEAFYEEHEVNTRG